MERVTNHELGEPDAGKMMLDLSCSQKSGNIFVADQTPTPTRLIKNCEEVGLFDDLRHMNMNPFDETFRRAVEQKTGQTNATTDDAHPDEDSLHTPQVFPQLDSVCGCELLQKPIERPVLDGTRQMLSEVEAYKIAMRQNSDDAAASSFLSCTKIHKCIDPSEKPVSQNDQKIEYVQLPNTIQVLQPQIITLSFSNSNHSSKSFNTSSTVIPVQTVRPFILPKITPTSNEKQQHQDTLFATEIPAGTSISNTSESNCMILTQSTTTQIANEPSSASLTPTSQLPIKERLKAILSSNNKSRITLEQSQNENRRKYAKDKINSHNNEDCRREHKRAAATRYRVKMRNEHQELRKRNAELQIERDKLRERVRQLEKELQKQNHAKATAIGNAFVVPTQIQIPSATLHLVMNIPKVVGQPIL